MVTVTASRSIAIGDLVVTRAVLAIAELRVVIRRCVYSRDGRLG